MAMVEESTPTTALSVTSDPESVDASRHPIDPNDASQDDLQPGETYRIPENFAMISPGLYRSSLPKPPSFPYLKKLGLKTIIRLNQEEYPDENVAFCARNGIRTYHFGVPGNKEPFVKVPEEEITRALAVILDRANHPILIHCRSGRHRTGCLVGCVRRIQNWALTVIFDEYRSFANPKSRSLDQQFIELYDLGRVWRRIGMKGLARLPWGLEVGEDARVQAMNGEEKECDGEGREIEDEGYGKSLPNGSIDPAEDECS